MSDELDNGAVDLVLAKLKDPETGRSAVRRRAGAAIVTGIGINTAIH